MPKLQSLLLATTNRHKVGELNGLLADMNISVIGLGEMPGLEALSVEENGLSFAENARIKALAYASKTDLPTLAEDSGICVAALGGAPGIYSARFGWELGENAPKTDLDRTNYLLEVMKNQSQREAWYNCSLCLAQGNQVLAEVSGKVNGVLTTELLGQGGFGYDPIFVPSGYTETFAQLPATVKTAISHRANAVAALKEHLRSLAS